MKASKEARKAIEWEEALKATMKEQIRNAVEEVVSSRLQSLSQPTANISPWLLLVEKQLCFYRGACEAR